MDRSPTPDAEARPEARPVAGRSGPRGRRLMFGLALALPLGLAAVAGCAGPEQGDAGLSDASEPFRIPVTIRTEAGPVTVQAEIADDPAERRQGLMFRTELADDHGMLFLFPREAQQTFWMRNTLIPLDIIFIRSDRTILGVVENAEPETDDPRSVPGRSQFVLEIAGGRARELGIAAEQRVEFMAPVPER